MPECFSSMYKTLGLAHCIKKHFIFTLLHPSCPNVPWQAQFIEGHIWVILTNKWIFIPSEYSQSYYRKNLFIYNRRNRRLYGNRCKLEKQVSESLWKLSFSSSSSIFCCFLVKYMEMTAKEIRNLKWQLLSYLIYLL